MRTPRRRRRSSRRRWKGWPSSRCRWWWTWGGGRAGTRRRRERRSVDHEELLALMADLESDRVERTESLDKADKFAQAICAFANDMPQNRRPGYLFVGVRDD